MTGGDFLHRMADASRARAREARRTESEHQLLGRALAAPPPPPLRLGSFDLIAELKLRSPAAGGLADGDFDRKAQISAYANGGAAAVSVLTEPDEFGGNLAHLSEAADALRPFGCPVMRKDFLTDPYQVIEARAAGAGGVLLIVTMLDDTELRAMLAVASDLGLFALLEGFDARDLERIGAIDNDGSNNTVLAGLNSRNLKTLEVDFSRFAELAGQLPENFPVVAESGVSTAEDVRTVAELGYRLALVGSALMRNEDPANATREFIETGRACVRRMAAQCS